MSRYLEPFSLVVAEVAYNPGRRPEVGVRFLRPEAKARRVKRR